MDESRLLKRKQKARRDGNISQLAQLSKELGDIYFETERLKDALLEYNDQLIACEVLDEKLNCAIAHRMIGEVHASLGEYEEALDHQTLHLEGAREAENVLEQQRALATIGRTHFCMGQALSEESTQRKEAFEAAKKAYSKSLRLCDELENTDIKLAEMMTMRARLLLNLGLVLEEQKEPQQAVELIEKAAELCKKHNLLEDLQRSHIDLSALHERQGHLGLALRHANIAVEIGDPSTRSVGQLNKAELLLRLGHWLEARQILVTLYLSKNLSHSASQEVQRLLRIVVTICRAEESLDVETDRGTRQSLYERLGDASVAVRSYDKALEYYRGMLSCADEEGSTEQISAALVSLARTFHDAARYDEAVPYARRELRLCTESSEICRSALYLADLLHLTNASKSDVMEIYDMALINARKCDNPSLEVAVLRDTIVYLEDTGEYSDAEEVKQKLNLITDSVTDTPSESESDGINIGADICLEDLSDVETEMRKKDGNCPRNSRRGKRGLVVKRNEKGETKLHVACINGNIEEVERLLEANHPTNVKDHCGWTPLHEAANHDFVEIAELLIKAGANVNDPGGSMCGGVTPLHDAASCGNFSIMCLLMKYGANMLLRTHGGDTVLDCLEGWRNRVEEDLSPTEQAEYDNMHAVLASILPRSEKNTNKSPISQQRRPLNGLTDEDDEQNERSNSGVERISASEDYRRTIENLKNRSRLLDSTVKRVSSTPKRNVAPLIDSEQILVDDWLEDDLNDTVRERTLVDDRVSSTSKRKTSNSTPELEKTAKRPRNISTDDYVDGTPSIIDDNSCESSNSDVSEIIFTHRNSGKAAKKRSRQLSLLKSGFTKDSISRTPSPIFNYNPETSNGFGRIGDDTSELIKLQIRIEEKVITLKLRFPEQRETTVASLMKDIVEKFEEETGCKVQITLMTMSGEILLHDHTLKNVRPVDGLVRLIAHIVEKEIPPIVDRYTTICKNHQIQTHEIVTRCLRICENTSTFRVKSGEAMDNEIVPLLKSLEYQEKLQILHMSGASLHNLGEMLNNTLKRLGNLQELHLEGCDIDHNCLAQIERLPAQLRILDLSYNPLGTRSQERLYNLIRHHRNLQTLNLRFCKLTNFQSSETWGSLVNLDLSWNPLNDEVASSFLRHQMLSLNLSNTRDTRNTSLSKEILDNSKLSVTTLETLELACCNLTDSDVLGILSRAANLSKFVVSGNSKVTKKSVEALLKRKPTLAHIDASGCEKIIEMPENDVYIDNPRICTLTVSMISEIEHYWRILWRDTANTRILPHDIIMFEPIVH